MKCLSRSTLGITIGGINVLGFTVAIIYIITIISDISDLSEQERKESGDILRTSITLLYILLIVCIFSIFISILLIVGIIKQSYVLMRPWICGAIAGIVYYILRIIITIIAGFTTGMSFGSIIVVLLVGLLTLGIQILIFYPIYTLYTDIRDAINEQEQRGLNNIPQNPPSYSELEKGEQMYH